MKSLLFLLAMATLSLVSKRSSALSDELETVSYFGSGGIGFAGIRCITTYSNRVYTVERDFSISEFDVDGGNYIRRSIRHLFSDDDSIDHVAYDGQFFYVLLSSLTTSYESIRFVKFSKSLKLNHQITLPPGRYCGLEVISDGVLRTAISNTYGVSRPTIVDIYSEQKRINSYQLSTYNYLSKYVRSNGIDLVSLSTSDRSEANQVHKIKGNSTQPLVALSEDESITAMSYSGDRLVCWLESAAMVTVRKGITTRLPYPDEFTIGDYGGQIISTIQMITTQDGSIIIRDDWGVGVLGKNLMIKHKFGYTDSATSSEPIAAVNDKGQVAIGKFGYVTVIRSRDEVIHVPLRSTTGVPMRVTAVAIDDSGTVFAAFMNEASILGSTFEPTIVRIDKTSNRESARIHLSDGYISDIVVIKDVYFISGGSLFEVGPNLNSGPKQIPLPYAAADLSVQNRFLYILTNQPSVLKINPRKRQLVDTIHVKYLSGLSEIFGAIWFFDIRPDESIIVDVFGQVTLEGIETGRYRYTDPLGNGSNDYIISVKDVVTVTKYGNN